jgi:PPM family protein phosphatase
VSDSFKDSLQEVLERALARDPSGRGRASIPVTWASTAGLHRKENQDRVLAGRNPSGVSIAVLADGMGGLEDGGRAAIIAASAVAARALQSRINRVAALAEDAIHFANQQVFSALGGRGGAAVVLAAWAGAEFAVVHAGDARAYAIDHEGFPLQLTVDDTVAGQFERLGRERPAHPNRGLLQFVGVGSDLEVRAQGLVTRPRGVILTSDGVHGMPGEVFRWAVHTATHLQALTDRLVLMSDWNGGTDNASAVCIGSQNGNEYRGPDGIECWVPGDHVVFIAELRSRELPAAPPPRTTSPVRDRQFQEPKPKKRAFRPKKAAKKTNRASTKPAPATPPTHTLPIEITFEPGDNEAQQEGQPQGTRPKSSGGEN